EVLPQASPDRPLVAARDDIDVLRSDHGSHQALTVGEAILAAEAQVQRQRARLVSLDEAPDAPLVVVRGELAGLPGGDSVRTRDFPGDDVIAEIGREQAEPVELVRIALRIGNRDESSERDAADPDRMAAQG